jgi:shikimate dehydrogenase
MTSGTPTPAEVPTTASASRAVPVPVLVAPSASHRAAVLGKPIAHSLSPALHRAGFHAVGLVHWTYDRMECDAAQLPGLLENAGAEWAGFSITMPGKAAAAAAAQSRGSRVDLLGAANTLLRTPEGWRAENTDVDGVIGALGAAGVRADSVLVLGGGGTARSVVAAVAEMGVAAVVLAGRHPAGISQCAELAGSLGLQVTLSDLSVDSISRCTSGVQLVVSTVPAGAADHLAAALASVPALLDAVYSPWPTPIAAAAGPGRITVTGLDMLMHQAFSQFELFTGIPAPKSAMRAGLLSASGVSMPLPVR